MKSLLHAVRQKIKRNSEELASHCGRKLKETVKNLLHTAAEN
jgi:hypothetical protein